MKRRAAGYRPNCKYEEWEWYILLPCSWPPTCVYTSRSVQLCSLYSSVLYEFRLSQMYCCVADIGFEIPDRYVVGYALDYNEYFRDLGVCLTLWNFLLHPLSTCLSVMLERNIFRDYYQHDVKFLPLHCIWRNDLLLFFQHLCVISENGRKKYANQNGPA